VRWEKERGEGPAAARGTGVGNADSEAGDWEWLAETQKEGDRCKKGEVQMGRWGKERGLYCGLGGKNTGKLSKVNHEKKGGGEYIPVGDSLPGEEGR